MKIAVIFFNINTVNKLRGKLLWSGKKKKKRKKIEIEIQKQTISPSSQQPYQISGRQ